MIIDRLEQKYFLNNEQFDNLLRLINNNLEKDKYFKERIYNIYFDNDQYEMINYSIDKPIYKEKIRLRSYNKDSNEVFLEIKKKYFDNSNKRRITLNYRDYLNNQINTNNQIANELNYYFNKYNLKPKIKVNYDRLSYYLKEDSSFRITFDNNIKYSFDNLNLYQEDKSKLLFNKGYIMEFKTFNGIPLWLNDILNKLKIYPTSFSKVGKIYEIELNNH